MSCMSDYNSLDKTRSFGFDIFLYEFITPMNIAFYIPNGKSESQIFNCSLSLHVTATQEGH